MAPFLHVYIKYTNIDLEKLEMVAIWDFSILPLISCVTLGKFLNLFIS